MSGAVSPLGYRRYRVQRKAKEPLLQYMLESLQVAGCTVIEHTPPTEAPFRISYETSWGERMGVLAYAFFANCKKIKKRPPDECRFQMKYGSKKNNGGFHDLWQDPFGIYTTLLLGIDPERGIFVAADPVLNNPTRLFISKEYKTHDAKSAEEKGWHWWLRGTRDRYGTQRRAEPVELLVGGTREHFLRYVMFERQAYAEDQGHRELLAERIADVEEINRTGLASSTTVPQLSAAHAHELEREFSLSKIEVFDLIERAPRLKMAVRGWVAERHLLQRLQEVPGVTDCVVIEADGQPDIRLRYKGSRPLLIECKNVLRTTTASGLMKLDFQRTRAAKGNECSRYYSAIEFDIVAACTHAHTETWDFLYRETREMEPHPKKKCEGRLSHLVKLNPAEWTDRAADVLESAARRAG